MLSAVSTVNVTRDLSNVRVLTNRHSNLLMYQNVLRLISVHQMVNNLAYRCACYCVQCVLFRMQRSKVITAVRKMGANGKCYQSFKKPVS